MSDALALCGIVECFLVLESLNRKNIGLYSSSNVMEKSAHFMLYRSVCLDITGPGHMLVYCPPYIVYTICQ